VHQTVKPRPLCHRYSLPPSYTPVQTFSSSNDLNCASTHRTYNRTLGEIIPCSSKDYILESHQHVHLHQDANPLHSCILMARSVMRESFLLHHFRIHSEYGPVTQGPPRGLHSRISSIPESFPSIKYEPLFRIMGLFASLHAQIKACISIRSVSVPQGF
jgi:hypothetical protein